jgi:hypothetical protein
MLRWSCEHACCGQQQQGAAAPAAWCFAALLAAPNEPRGFVGAGAAGPLLAAVMGAPAPATLTVAVHDRDTVLARPLVLDCAKAVVGRELVVQRALRMSASRGVVLISTRVCGCTLLWVRMEHDAAPRHPRSTPGLQAHEQRPGHHGCSRWQSLAPLPWLLPQSWGRRPGRTGAGAAASARPACQHGGWSDAAWCCDPQPPMLPCSVPGR